MEEKLASSNSVQTKQRSPLGRVMNRLEQQFTQEGKIEKRTNDIIALVNSSPTEANLIEKFQYDDDRPKPKKEEEAQDYLIAYLYSKIRSEFVIQKREYDPKKERLQVITILNLLAGNHVHLPTGFGKSSVVLPITTIVHALTKKEDPILTTASDKLVEDLKKYLDHMVNWLPQELKTDIELVKRGEPEKKTFGENYWQNQLSASESLSFLEKKTKSTIFVTDERSLVFETISKPNFWGKLPWVYFDEAHVPFDRGSPYILTPDPEMTKEAKEDYRIQWIISRILSGILKSNHFEKKDTSKILSNQVNSLIDFYAKEGFPPDLITEASALITTAELPQEKIKAEFETWWQESDLPSREDLITLLAEHIAMIQNYRHGSEYIIGEQGQLVVRDRYLGALLAKHRFSPYIHLALSANAGKYSETSLDSIAGSMMNFSSFIALVLRGRLSTTSGTLFFPDLITKEFKPTAFSQFLENVTTGKVVAVDRSTKQPPAPEFYDNDDETLSAMVGKLECLDNEPTLICCWNEEEGTKIKEELEKKFPGQVQLLNEENEEKIYNLMDNKDCSARFAISTGRAGLGIDIKYKNLRVALYNMPLTRIQIWQAIGRRRGEGEDFHWFSSLTSLEKFFDLLKPSLPLIERKLGKQKTIEEVTTYLKDVDPEKRLVGVNYLFEQYEKNLAADTEIEVALDKFYHERFEKEARWILEKWVREKYQKNPEFFLGKDMLFKEKILKSIIQARSEDKPHVNYSIEDIVVEAIAYPLVGFPESLYWLMRRELAFIFDAQGTKDLIENKLVHKLLAKVPGQLAILPEQLEEWAEKRLDQDMIAEFNQIFDVIDQKILPQEKDNLNQLVIGGYSQKYFDTNVGYNLEEFNKLCVEQLGCPYESSGDYFHPFKLGVIYEPLAEFGYVITKDGNRIATLKSANQYFPLLKPISEVISPETAEKIIQLVNKLRAANDKTVEFRYVEKKGKKDNKIKIVPVLKMGDQYLQDLEFPTELVLLQPGEKIREILVSPPGDETKHNRLFIKWTESESPAE